MIASCFVGYSETSKAYRIKVQTLWKIMMSQDMKFDEDVTSSSSQVSPREIEGSAKVVVS